MLLLDLTIVHAFQTFVLDAAMYTTATTKPCLPPLKRMEPGNQFPPSLCPSPRWPEQGAKILPVLDFASETGVRNSKDITTNVVSGNFLVELGFPQYKCCFGQVTADDLKVLGIRHLPALGITDFSHQKRIMNALRRLISGQKKHQPSCLDDKALSEPSSPSKTAKTARPILERPSGVTSAPIHRGGSHRPEAPSLSDDIVFPSSCSEYFKTFEGAFGPLAEQTDAGRAIRAEQWKEADQNGSGSCSLCEIDTWIKTRLVFSRKRINNVNMAKLASFRRKSIHKLSDEEQIWLRFRPSYIKAFNDAADVIGNENLQNDGLVQKQEFRILCAYLCVYARMYDAFYACQGHTNQTGLVPISNEDDAKLTLQEWQAGFKCVRGHGFIGLREAGNTASSNAVFSKMDRRNQGAVLLSEWCTFLKKSEQQHDTELGRLLSTGDRVQGARRILKKRTA